MSTRSPSSRKRLPVNGRAFSEAATQTLRQLSPAALRRRSTFPFRAPTIPLGAEPAETTATTGADFETEWARRYPARAARVLLVEGVVRPAMAALAAPRVMGQDRLSGMEGPAIFAANHHSHIDTPLLLSQIPEPWRHHMVIGAAADYFFGTRITGTLSALVIGAIPIERTKVTRRSADLASELIADGWSFLIFPEGGRSPDGWGQPFRGGAAYLSLRCSVPVVPIHIAGTGRILRKGKSLPKPSATRITFGHPMRAHDGEDSRHFAARLEREVAALADEGATDWYTARVRAHATETPSLQGGDDLGAWRRAWALGNRDRRSRERDRARRWPDLD